MAHRLSLALSLALLACGHARPPATTTPVAAAAVPHPLDPLTAAELALAVQVVGHGHDFPHGAFFPLIALHEPPKAEVLAWTPGAHFRREASVVVLDRAGNRTFEAVVDLAAAKLLSWKLVPGAEPLVLNEEYATLDAIVRADPRWQAAMRRRGIADLDKIQIDGWAVGLEPASHDHQRLLRALSYLKDAGPNFYGRPIEGVIAVVDMNAGKVIELSDPTPVPLPPPSTQLDEASLGRRADLKPLTIAQPDGPSFEVRGHEVRWQKWRFRYGFDPREGLILHQVVYDDGGKPRSVLYRGSIDEMVVPYGDPDPNWTWRSAFDVGEYGVGRLASPLEPGQDGPANARYFDAAFADDFGKPYVLPRAVGIYEQDDGILWKHFESYSGTDEVRRSRSLHIFFVAAVGNYDYIFSWIFHQDGSLEADAGLTGIMLPKAVDPAMAMDHAAHGSHGHLVQRGVVAPHHQHFFSFRLDLDVDGAANSALEMNSHGLPMDAANPIGNTIVMETTALDHEAVAQRDLDATTARKWEVYNPAITTALGYHPGYALVPGETSWPYAARGSNVRARAGFIDHHVWVTRYKPDERYAAGDYPNQGPTGDGLPRYVGDDEALDATDLVLWYTTGVTHVPRPEEWPIMSVHHIGFQLVPVGFFDRNPALDVPRSTP